MNSASHSQRNPGSITVRSACASDVASLGAQYVQFLASYGHDADIQNATEFISRALGQPWVRFLVATDSRGRIIGFAGGSLTYSAVSLCSPFTINDLFVLPSERGRGVATALLTGLEQCARNDRCAKLFVEAATDATVVIELYERAGFSIQPHVTLKKEVEMAAAPSSQQVTSSTICRCLPRSF